MIRFACPKCRTAFRVRADRAGKRASCPACGQRLRVPRPKVAPPQRRAEPETADTGPGLLTLVLAGCLLVALAGVVAAAGIALARPAAGAAAADATSGPAQPVDPPTTAADSATDTDPRDPDLFETPPRNYRSLPAARRARLQRQYEAIYLDPTADDDRHIAAANVLLGLSDGSTSFLKGLDVYEGRPESRRRYRWCLQYLCVMQVEQDQAAPGGKAAGLIPARHLPAMVAVIRDLNPAKRPDRQGEFYTTLKYLAKHGEGAAPVLPALRGMQARFAGNDAVAQEVQEAIRGVEQRQ
jgi:hypothetical protein